MALTLNQFTGFETGGLEEATGGTAGSPDATEAVIVRSGDRALAMPDAAAEYDINLFDEVSNAGTDHVFGFGVYFQNLHAVSDNILEVQDSSNNAILTLRMNTIGTITLFDSSFSSQISDNIISAGRWHFIEVYFQNTGTGASEVFVDGNSIGTDPSADYDTGTALTSVRIIGTSNQDGIVYFDDFYWLSGATSAADRYGPGVSVYGYQNAQATAAPGFDEIGVNGAGDNLDIGQWQSPSDIPWNDTTVGAEYTGSSAVGGCVRTVGTSPAGPGPVNGNKIISGIIKGAKWGWRGDRSGGGSTTQQVVFGSYDGAGNADMGAGNPTTVTLLSGTATNHFVLLGSSDAGVPSNVDEFVIGIANNGGRDWELIAYEAFLLHVSSVTVTDLSDGLMPEYPSPGLTLET